VTHVVVLGAGLIGLSTAMLLARDGHEVTVLERDPAEPPEPRQAWEAWQRGGVHQFRLPHFMLPAWRAQMAAELPDVLDDLAAAGGMRINGLAVLPEAVRGPLGPTDARFDVVTARRPVLEAVIAAAAARTPGVTIRRGAAVTGLLTGPAADVPRVTGVLLAGGDTVRGDLVVDCTGRRSPLASWLRAAGARPPAEERADSGFVYYGRHFRSRTGRLPEVRATMLQRYNSVSIITLPADNDTWSVAFIASTRDKALRALREPQRWAAALALYPVAAHWAEGEAITGVDAFGGMEDRLRALVVDGVPVATGVVAVGDSWACTNPSLGRGATIGLRHARCLRDVLRETGAGDPDAQDPDKLVRRFAEATESLVEPLYRATVWYDRHRLAEIDADVAGVPYDTDDPRWAVSNATFAAALADSQIARAYLSLSGFLNTPDELFAQPGLLDRVMSLAAGAPTYPLPGPTRHELLRAIG
jgi:2-polyprenyl-6-methoxyphenol hydroxylase-like FAD-dependent oxidoreductase